MDRQSIYCSWEMAITLSAKQVAGAAGSGLDRFIILKVTGSIARFPELITAALHQTGGKMLWDWDIRVVGLLLAPSVRYSFAWIFSMQGLSCLTWRLKID